MYEIDSLFSIFFFYFKKLLLNLFLHFPFLKNKEVTLGPLKTEVGYLDPYYEVRTELPGSRIQGMVYDVLIIKSVLPLKCNE